MVKHTLFLVFFSFSVIYSMNHRGLVQPSQQPQFFVALQQDSNKLIRTGQNLNQKHMIAGYPDVPLVRVCRYHHPLCEQLAEQLLRAGANPNIGNPLHHAAQANAVSMVQLLLQHGANINSLCASEKTALHVAIEFGSLGAAKVLLENGADAGIQERLHSETPLMYAIKKMKVARQQHNEEECKQWQTLIECIENSSSLNVTNDQGETAYDLIEQAGLIELVNIDNMKTQD